MATKKMKILLTEKKVKGMVEEVMPVLGQEVESKPRCGENYRKQEQNKRASQVRSKEGLGGRSGSENPCREGPTNDEIYRI